MTLFFFFFDFFVLVFVLAVSSTKEYGMLFTQKPFQSSSFDVLLAVLARRCTHRQWFVAALYVQAFELTVNMGTGRAAAALAAALAAAVAAALALAFFFFADRFFGERRAAVDATFPILFLCRRKFSARAGCRQ